jgi:TnpA family transposase
MCRERSIVAPPAAVLERMCADLRHHARREAHRRLTQGLSAEQRRCLDALTERRDEGGLSWFTWLRQMPEAATSSSASWRAINGVLKVAPIEKSTPPEAETLAARLYAMLPRIRITDLLAEVGAWTQFPGCFTHLRTSVTVADTRILMAGLLADGLNLGLTRMAEACSIASLGQLAWTADWHIREETYSLALRCLVNQQQCEPLAAIFGTGTASSSDGQFFQAAGFGRDAGRLNAHYGQRPGFKVYTHLSDRYGPFHTKLVAATASEALHVLDALLYHQSEVVSQRHHTDGGGDSEHVFALCALLGFQFSPRIPDLKHRRLFSFDKPSTYPALEPMIAGRINVALIRAHWFEILRVAASIRTGTVTASLIMRQLAAHPRQNGVAAALRELGRLERTLFLYVTWNLFGPGVTLDGRRHGEHCAAGRALAGPCRRASCTSMARHSVGPRSRSAYARRILAGPFRISGVLCSGVDQSIDRRTRSRRSVRA